MLCRVANASFASPVSTPTPQACLDVCPVPPAPIPAITAPPTAHYALSASLLIRAITTTAASPATRRPFRPSTITLTSTSKTASPLRLTASVIRSGTSPIPLACRFHCPAVPARTPCKARATANSAPKAPTKATSRPIAALAAPSEPPNRSRAPSSVRHVRQGPSQSAPVRSRRRWELPRCQAKRRVHPVAWATTSPAVALTRASPAPPAHMLT
mmetsp:Transcript_30274/g.55300  ORF Transcript_30274/g.55300 Transcript_30274/m.55300 type:complete len:214 (+) Transcript_30274:966-1607(+)